MKMTTVTYKGFAASVNYNRKSGLYSAKANNFAGPFFCSYGHSMEELEKNYQNTINQYLRGYEELGAFDMSNYAA